MILIALAASAVLFNSQLTVGTRRFLATQTLALAWEAIGTRLKATRDILLLSRNHRPTLKRE